MRHRRLLLLLVILVFLLVTTIVLRIKRNPIEKVLSSKNDHQQWLQQNDFNSLLSLTSDFDALSSELDLLKQSQSQSHGYTTNITSLGGINNASNTNALTTNRMNADYYRSNRDLLLKLFNITSFLLQQPPLFQQPKKFLFFLSSFTTKYPTLKKIRIHAEIYTTLFNLLHSLDSGELRTWDHQFLNQRVETEARTLLTQFEKRLFPWLNLPEEFKSRLSPVYLNKMDLSQQSLASLLLKGYTDDIGIVMTVGGRHFQNALFTITALREIISMLHLLF
jgi:hypothetical protein